MSLLTSPNIDFSKLPRLPPLLTRTLHRLPVPRRVLGAHGLLVEATCSSSCCEYHHV
jgi:hypothetical protein